ncbi:MAG: MarR family transcriptional regulator [Dehalococcoidia bacterium]
MINSKQRSIEVVLLRQLYLTYTRFKNCFDEVLSGQGLTMEKYIVLSVVKNLEAPVRITDIARWTERSTNSVTMLVDRMVKAGLVRRVRDRSDRRQVNVFVTSKGEDIFRSASIVVMDYSRQIMSPLSNEDAHTFIGLFNMIDRKMLKLLYPGADIEGILKTDSERSAYLSKHLK